MLINAPTLAIRNVDTTENEPLKVCRKIQFIIQSPPEAEQPLPVVQEPLVVEALVCRLYW